MNIKGKNITFHSEMPDIELRRPAPASRFVPDWYRLMPGVEDRVETVKKCIPVLDALTLGYMIPLSADVTYNHDEKQIISNATFKVNSDHIPVQTKNVPLLPGFDSQPHKWVNNWHIKTPKGYSTLFIHPLNRQDLPFYSFSGVVDTDTHPLVINFPFVIKEDFRGVIPAGTPMIQAIPFKRDDWDSTILDTGDPYTFNRGYENQNAPLAWYKRKAWNKKVFR